MDVAAWPAPRWAWSGAAATVAAPKPASGEEVSQTGAGNGLTCGAPQAEIFRLGGDRLLGKKGIRKEYYDGP